MSRPVTAEQFNAAHPIGTIVRAYPSTRQDRWVIGPTRSVAWNLGHGVPVVQVDGLAGGIALTHVDIEPTTGGQVRCARCDHPADHHRLDDASGVSPTDPAAEFRCVHPMDGRLPRECACADMVVPAYAGWPFNGAEPPEVGA